MCGLAGFLSSQSLGADAEATALSMARRLAHRGPDDAGTWVDREAGIALAHRRLAILDLSAAGHQPMSSHSGRFLIAYNGEIYNFEQLRRELGERGDAPAWRGHSDTEVLLAAIDAWGVYGALRRLNGMFAFALWDREERKLTLARDIIGEKPLYYGHLGRTFVFGSELKAITAFPGFDKSVDDSALHLFLRHNYVPSPYSIWEGISKLPPGHYLEMRRGREPRLKAYWTLEDVAARALERKTGSFAEASAELEDLLLDAVKLRMQADVPLGAFLSGGVDSSLIVALMQAQSADPIKTFTIGYEEKAFDEAPFGAAVASHLGTSHHELRISAQDGLAVIPGLAEIWDEPFSDSSQIPTLLVSRLTRDHVTVSLSGDAGDELFGGYHRYFAALRIWNASARLPRQIRRGLVRLSQSPALAKATGAAFSVHPRLRSLLIADRLPKIGAVLAEERQMDLYRRLVSHVDQPETLLLDKSVPVKGGFDEVLLDRDFRERMMFIDTLTYLPDDILVKVDRASMAVSLESRVPFLDPRIIDFAWALPLDAKIGRRQGKAILRDILYRYVPRELIERPKMGFAVPIDSWLRSELRDWAEALLDPVRLRHEGFFDSAAVRALWDGHLSGRQRSHYVLWDILMFQAWYEHNRTAVSGAASARPTELCH